MDKKVWLILSILCAIIGIVFIILVIVVPPSDEESEEEVGKDQWKELSTPGENNKELWASFPGDLQTKNIHGFNFFEYNEDRTKAFLKDSIKLEEKTKYENFDFSDEKIDFDAVSTFNIPQSNNQKNEKINTLSLGLFETLETLSNPQIYQQAISSIEVLIRKAFQSPDLFNRHLYSYYLKSTLSKEDIQKNILDGVDQLKKEEITKCDSDYCLTNTLGFDNWVKLVGKEEEIKNVKWLKDLFDLTNEEINSVFGRDKYLYTTWVEFNKNLASKYNCKNPDFCGVEIIYNQLIDGKVIKDLGNNLNSLIDLYKEIKIEYYPFSKSPELFIYSNQYNKENYKANYQLTVEQLENLIGEKSTYSLLSTSNSIFFLSKVQSNEIKAIIERYGLKDGDEETVKFLCSYFFEYLPKLLLYGEDSSISPAAKMYAKMALDDNLKTYYHMSKVEDVFNKFLMYLIWNDLDKEIMNETMDYDEEDLCYLMMQQVLDDGRKVLKICSDPVTSFKTKNEINKWFGPIYCHIEGEESKCDESIIDHLKEIIYITEDEIKSIFQHYSFEEHVINNFKLLNDYWKDKCEDNECYLKRQFWTSEITLNLPEGMKTRTMHDIFPDLVPNPAELNYYLDGKGSEIPETAIDLLIYLTPKNSDNIFDEANYVAFHNLLELEKEFTLLIKNKEGTKDEKFKAFDVLNNLFLFNDDMIFEYGSIENILQGNNLEDKKYVDYLASGDYFYNYKPKLNKTTGFNFGFNLDTKDEVYVPYDRYSIDRKNLRKIININNSPFLNIKKVEYDHVTDNYVYVDTPILNYQNLNGEKSFIDGFEYDHDGNTIYYYDRISSRPYKFNYTEDVVYNDLTCKKYVLDKANIADGMNEKDESGKAFMSKKLNKPFVISVGKDDIKNIEISDNITTENYIYVEPYSNMVLKSEINFVYSLYTKNYGYIYPNIENDKIYPIFTYSKTYDVTKDSFNKVFPVKKSESEDNYNYKFLTIGIIIIVICFILAGFFCYKYFSHKRSRISLFPDDEKDTSLINDSRDPTVNNMP